jgi:hypothetical protein
MPDFWLSAVTLMRGLCARTQSHPRRARCRRSALALQRRSERSAHRLWVGHVRATEGLDLVAPMTRCLCHNRC